MSTGASIYFYHHTPSGQSRVCRVTQLRTDGVHCREYAGPGQAVLKVVGVTGAPFASPWTNYYCAPLFSHTHYWYKVSMFKLSGVCQDINAAGLFNGLVFPLRLMPVQGYTVQYHPLFVKTLSRLYCCCTVDLFPPDLFLYKRKEFSVHGTISSVVF